MPTPSPAHTADLGRFARTEANMAVWRRRRREAAVRDAASTLRRTMSQAPTRKG